MSDVYHRVPAGLPAPRVAPHEAQREDAALTLPFEHGDLRRRPIWRSVPQNFTVEYLFTQAQFDTWHDWYENQLLAGAMAFYAPLAAQGADGVVRNFGLAWWEARFARPYDTSVINAGGNGFLYSIRAAYVVSGTPAAQMPALADFTAGGTIAATGYAIAAAVPLAAAGTNTVDGAFTDVLAPS